MSYTLTSQEFEHYWWQIVNRCRVLDYNCKIKGNISYYFTYPTPEQWLSGSFIYNKVFSESVDSGIRTYNALEKEFVAKYNIFSESDQHEVNICKDRVTALKKDLRKLKRAKAAFPPIINKKNEEIRDAELRYAALLMKKMQYFKDTAEGLAERARNLYFISNCVFLLDPSSFEKKEALFGSYNVLKKSRANDQEFTTFLLNSISTLLYGIPHDISRALARYSLVKVQWRICRQTGINFFGMPVEISKSAGKFYENPVSWWTLDQINLSSWLLYYDDVVKNYEPPEHLLKNDEKLDEWVDRKVKERESERIKNAGSTRDAFDHQDVIVFGQDKEFIFDSEEQ